MEKDNRKNSLTYGQKVYTIERNLEKRLIIREYILNEILMEGPVCADEYMKSTPKPTVKRILGFAEKEGNVKIRREFTHTLLNPGYSVPEGSDAAYTTRKAAEAALRHLMASASKNEFVRPERRISPQEGKMPAPVKR